MYVCMYTHTHTHTHKTGIQAQTHHLVMSVEKGYIYGSAVTPACVSKMEVFCDDKVNCVCTYVCMHVSVYVCAMTCICGTCVPVLICMYACECVCMYV